MQFSEGALTELFQAYTVIVEKALDDELHRKIPVRAPAENCIDLHFYIFGFKLYADLLIISTA